MDKQYEMVKDFQTKQEHPVAAVPTILPADRVKCRGTWMSEELIEFAQATTLVDQVDALIDLMYFIMGTFVEMGVQPEKIFKIVHEANMTKPNKKIAGKTTKDASWQPPETKIAMEIAAQTAKAYKAMATAQLDRRDAPVKTKRKPRVTKQQTLSIPRSEEPTESHELLAAKAASEASKQQNTSL